MEGVLDRIHNENNLNEWIESQLGSVLTEKKVSVLKTRLTAPHDWNDMLNVRKRQQAIKDALKMYKASIDQALK